MAVIKDFQQRTILYWNTFTRRLHNFQFWKYNLYRQLNSLWGNASVSHHYLLCFDEISSFLQFSETGFRTYFNYYHTAENLDNATINQGSPHSTSQSPLSFKFNRYHLDYGQQSLQIPKLYPINESTITADVTHGQLKHIHSYVFTCAFVFKHERNC